ncbi:MAG: WD40 repeat domain-containing protein [Bryobacteraceae bacterium]
MFELPTGRKVAQVQELVYSRNAAVQAGPALSADGAYVATGNGDRHAQVFDTKTGKEVFRAGYGGAVSAVALDPKGKLLAVAQDRVRIYDLASKRQIRRIDTGTMAAFTSLGRSFQNAIMFNSAIAFSPDSRMLAAALTDHSVRLLDVDSGKELLRIHHQGPIHGLRFSADGKSLIVTENVSRIVTHPLDPDDLIARSCSLLTRNLTTKEWTTYIGVEPYEKVCPALP